MAYCLEILNGLAAPWRMDAVFTTILVLAIASGKALSAAISPGECWERVRFLLVAPAVSIETWRRSRAVSVYDLGRLTLAAVAMFFSLAMFYVYVRPWVSLPQVPWVTRSYLCLAPYLLVTAAVGTTAQILFAFFGIHVQPLHERPWLSQSVAEFWGSVLEAHSHLAGRAMACSCICNVQIPGFPPQPSSDGEATVAAPPTAMGLLSLLGIATAVALLSSFVGTLLFGRG